MFTVLAGSIGTILCTLNTVTCEASIITVCLTIVILGQGSRVLHKMPPNPSHSNTKSPVQEMRHWQEQINKYKDIIEQQDHLLQVFTDWHYLCLLVTISLVIVLFRIGIH